MTGLKWIDYSGIVHIHSTFSDGLGSMKEIINTACSENVDYIITTDHNTLAPKHYEGWYGDTLVLVEEEITQNNNHLLALNICDEILPPIGAQQSIDAVLAQKGLAFLAHPFYQGSNLIHDPPILWDNWQVKGFTGMEIWNFTAEFYESLSGEKHLRPLEEYLPLMHPKAEVFQMWDQLQQERRVVGLGGVDAHAEQIMQSEKKVTLLPYAKIFNTVRMHLLLNHPLSGSLPDDRRAVYAALGGGHGYIAFEYELPVDCFTFAVVDRTSTAKGIMGDAVTWEPGLFLSIDVPKPATIRIIRNGREFEEIRGSSLFLRIEHGGCYRVEIHRNHVPWIISNPIYIKGG